MSITEMIDNVEKKGKKFYKDTHKKETRDDIVKSEKR